MIDTKNVPCTPGVYFIADPDTNKGYLGSSSNVKERIIVHVSRLNRGVHGNQELQEAFNRSNGNLVLSVCPLETQDEALDAEQANLDVLGGKGVLFNRATDARASMSGLQNPPSEETRMKLSAASKGVPKSEQHRASLSAAKKGIPQTEEVIAKRVEKLQKPVVIDDVTYPSIGHAAEDLGMSYFKVLRRLDKPAFPGWTRVKTA